MGRGRPAPPPPWTRLSHEHGRGSLPHTVHGDKFQRTGGRSTTQKLLSAPREWKMGPQQNHWEPFLSLTPRQDRTEGPSVHKHARHLGAGRLQRSLDRPVPAGQESCWARLQDGLGCLLGAGIGGPAEAGPCPNPLFPGSAGLSVASWAWPFLPCRTAGCHSSQTAGASVHLAGRSRVLREPLEGSWWQCQSCLTPGTFR